MISAPTAPIAPTIATFGLRPRDIDMAVRSAGERRSVTAVRAARRPAPQGET